MTWLEVADDAIKIGLGALIGGGASLLTKRFSLERESRRRYATRKRNLLEKVLGMVTDFDKIYRHQKAAVENIFQFQQYPAELKLATEQFSQLDEKLRGRFEIFADAAGILLMLGEDKTAAALERYRASTTEWYTLSGRLPAPESEGTLNALREKILKDREHFMTELAIAFKVE